MKSVTLRLAIHRSPDSDKQCIITCSASQTIEEVMNEHAGLSSGEEGIGVYRGRVLSPYLTLNFYDITDGAKIVIAVRRFMPIWREHLRCDISLKSRHRQQSHDIDLTRRWLADLTFIPWEVKREFGSMLREMAESPEDLEEEPTMTVYPTILQPSGALCETPLPTPGADELRSTSDH
jgi:hypothetical protein